MTIFLDRLKDIGYSIINSYSQIIFSEKKLVGILILLGTLIEPYTGITGILGTLIALIISRLFNFDIWDSRSGFLAFNSTLVCLGIGFYMPNALLWTPVYWLFLIGASVITLFMFISLNNITINVLKMPSMSLSFSVVAILLSFFLMRLNYSLTIPERWLTVFIHEVPDGIVSRYLCSMGSIFFSPNIITGIFVIVAILIASRIGFTLTGLGFLISYLLMYWFDSNTFTNSSLYQISFTSFNLAFIAISLGGVYFVPSLLSYITAIFACVLGFILTYSIQFFFENYYVAPFAFPMIISVYLFVIAFRVRLQNKQPFMAEFGYTIPEDNLKYFQSNIKRFYQVGSCQFCLPFIGEWVVTQGNNGDITHQKEWRYAWDFEIEDVNGHKYRNDGKRVENYYCYGKPVLSSADGYVVNFVDGIEDNPIGQINTRENWGNFIVISHGYGLYSMYCHIKKGTIKVHNGQWVPKGTKLALVGNSGRSAVPHLHFNVQNGQAPGSTTIQSQIVNYKLHGENLEFKAFDIPSKGQKISSLVSVNYLQDYLHLKVNDDSKYLVEANGEKFEENLTVEVDLLGRFYIKSDRGSVLEFSVYDGIFNVLNYKGKESSILQAFAILLSRLPLYKNGELKWGDVPPYSVLVNSFFENMILYFQSFYDFIGVKSFSSSLTKGRSTSVKSSTYLNILNHTLARYTGDIEIEELKGITDISLNKNDRGYIKGKLINE